MVVVLGGGIADGACFAGRSERIAGSGVCRMFGHPFCRHFGKSATAWKFCLFGMYCLGKCFVFGDAFFYPVKYVRALPVLAENRFSARTDGTRRYCVFRLRLFGNIRSGQRDETRRTPEARRGKKRKKRGFGRRFGQSGEIFPTFAKNRRRNSLLFAKSML